MDSHIGSQTDSHPDSQPPARAQTVPGTSAIDGSPRVRLAILGLDRSGEFHAERLSLRPEFEIVTACDPLGAKRRLPGPRGQVPPLASRPEDLLARADVETVLIAGPTDRRAAWAVQSLEAGKHACLDAPPCTSAQELRDVLTVARRTGRRLTVVSTRNFGTEFRTALEIAQSGRLGDISAARLLSWGGAVPVGANPNESSDERDVDLFAVFAYQYVDQLQRLVRSRPRSVFARILPASRLEPATAFLLSIAFGPGVDALIDVNLVSGAALHTGWMLAGSRGGYAAGRIYLRDDSGEICDAPAPATDLPDIDPYADLLAHADSKGGPAASADEAEQVLRVIDVARESSRREQSVPLVP